MIVLVQEKKNSINFSKAKAKFCLILHYNGVNDYLHVNKTGIYKFKASVNIHWNEFCVESISKDFTKDEQNVYH